MLIVGPMCRVDALSSGRAVTFSAVNHVARITGLGAPVKRDRLLGLRLSVIEGGQELGAAKLIQPGEGNLSARIDQDRFLVTPTLKDKSRLDPDELIEIEINSHRVPEGASTEVEMHRAIYAVFPSVHAVVHAHPVKVLALADEGSMPDPSRLPNGGTALDRVAWVDDFPVGSRSLADEVARGIAQAPALVLAAHGAVTIGATVDQAVLRMIRLERLALTTRGG